MRDEHIINMFLRKAVTAKDCPGPSFSNSDPKKSRVGSYGTAPARSGAETQHVPLVKLRFLLYAVFIPCPATARSPPKRAVWLFPDRGTLPETVK